MAWEKGKQIPTNLIVGFLGSGKTTAITHLIANRPKGEKWSILVNEYGTVSIDQALVDPQQDDIDVEELGGGCACCTMAFLFQPLLAKFIRRTKPDRLMIEPSGASHPAKIIDFLRNENFRSVIEVRNTICLIDPQDFDDPRWRETEVFHDQVQLADIVVLNWSDKRGGDLIERCREWVESFTPPKLMITESSFGRTDPAWLDLDGLDSRMAMYPDAHPTPPKIVSELPLVTNLGDNSKSDLPVARKGNDTLSSPTSNVAKPQPGQPIRSRNRELGYDACGWIFHVDDVFDRDALLDLLGYIHPILRLKGVFRCPDGWWSINRAKDVTSFAPTAYRRDSRLEIFLPSPTSGWDEVEQKLLQCRILCPDFE